MYNSHMYFTFYNISQFLFSELKKKLLFHNISLAKAIPKSKLQSKEWDVSSACSEAMARMQVYNMSQRVKT